MSRAQAKGAGSGRGGRPALAEALAAGRTLELDQDRWPSVRAQLTVIREVPTGLAGPLLLVTYASGDGKARRWAVVEQPDPGRRLLHPAAGRRQAQELVGQRLAAYERLWDG